MPILGARPGIATRIAIGLTAVPSFRGEEIKTERLLPQVSAPIPPLPARKGSTLLARRAQYHPQSLLTSKQLILDQASRRIVQELTHPATILLWVSGSYLIKSAPVMIGFERLAQTSARIYLNHPAAKMGAGVALTVLACDNEYDNLPNQSIGYDAGNDMEPDYGTIALDSDEDGVPMGIDCDDQNPRKFPLIADIGLRDETSRSVTIQIKENTEICPGIYSGFTLEIPPGTKSIEVKGEGVILDGRVDGISVYDHAFRILGSEAVRVSGFRIQFYEEPPSGPGTVRILDSKDVSLTNLHITAASGFYPIRLERSVSTLIDGVATLTRSARGVYVENSNYTVIRNSSLSATLPRDYPLTDSGLLHFIGGIGNQVEGVSLTGGQGYGLFVRGGLEFIVRDSTFRENDKDGILLLNVKDSTFERNNVNTNSGYGLFPQGNTINNRFYRNDFTGNTLGAYGRREGMGDAPLEQNTFIENSPQP